MQGDGRLVRLLDAQRLCAWHAGIVFSCFMALFLDGMDVSAPSVTTSAILRSWGGSTGTLAMHLGDFGWSMNPMGLAFSAANLGTLLGLLIFATVGDRFGRKWGLVGGVILYSVPSCLVQWPVFCTPDAFIALRLIAGLGVGGVMPNAVALVVETAPSRRRAALVLVTLTGYAMGAILSGLLAAWVAATPRWTLLFVLPGIAGLVLVVLFVARLPESLKFLAIKRPESAQFAKLCRRLFPGESVAAMAQDARSARPPAQARRFGELFHGHLKLVTPILWLGYFAISIAFLSVLSWQTFLLETLGVSGRLASMSFSLASIGAVLVQLSLSRLVDRFGPLPAAFVATASAAGLLSLAVLHNSDSAAKLIAIILAVGCGSVTFQMYAMTSGLFYPTPIRGRGIGWAGGVGRVGAIAGPFIAGHFLAAGLPVHLVIYMMAVPYLIVVPACAALGFVYVRSRAASGA